MGNVVVSVDLFGESIHVPVEGTEVQDVATLGFQVVDVGLLVGEAPIFEDVAEGVVSEGPLASFQDHAHVEAGEVAAGEGVGEVGGGEAQAGAGFVHPGRLGDMRADWGPIGVGSSGGGLLRRVTNGMAPRNDGAFQNAVAPSVAAATLRGRFVVRLGR